MKPEEKIFMRYKANHIRRLHDEVIARQLHLLSVLNVPITYSGDFISIDGSEVRMAVDDFKCVLSEIRRLK